MFPNKRAKLWLSNFSNFNYIIPSISCAKTPKPSTGSNWQFQCGPGQNIELWPLKPDNTGNSESRLLWSHMTCGPMIHGSRVSLNNSPLPACVGTTRRWHWYDAPPKPDQGPCFSASLHVSQGEFEEQNNAMVLKTQCDVYSSECLRRLNSMSGIQSWSSIPVMLQTSLRW